MKIIAMPNIKISQASTTSNDIIAGDGREWFLIEYKLKNKCFCVFLRYCLISTSYFYNRGWANVLKSLIGNLHYNGSIIFLFLLFRQDYPHQSHNRSI